MLDKCQRRRNRGGQQMMRAKQNVCRVGIYTDINT